MHAESADDLAREYGVVAVAALQGKSALVDDHPGIEGCAVADAGIVVYAGKEGTYGVIVEAELAVVGGVAQVELLLVAHALACLVQVAEDAAHYLAGGEQGLLGVVGHGAVGHALDALGLIAGGIVHGTPSAQEVEVEVGTHGKCLATYHAAGGGVGEHGSAIEVPPLEQVVGIGDDVVLCLPGVGEHSLGVVGTAGLAVVDVDAVAVGGAVGELVVELCQLLGEPEAEVLAVGVLFGHGDVEACEGARESILGGEELLGGHIGVGHYIEPLLTRGEGEQGDEEVCGSFHFYIIVVVLFF